jgi:hypothetical protein
VARRALRWHKGPLKGSPGVRFLDYGKIKEGYWNYDLFRQQVEDLP